MSIVPRFAVRFILAGCVDVLIAPGFCQADGDAATLPKYLLPVGRKLTYSLSSVDKSDHFTETESGDFEMTVVRANADGSARVLLRQSITTQRDTANQPVAQARLNFAYADVFPDGRITPNPTLVVEFSPREILPPLPGTRDELKYGWLHHDALRLREFTFTPRDPGAEEFIFAGTLAGPMSQIYGVTETRTIHFDSEKGMMRLSESAGGQIYGFHSALSSRTTLLTDEQIPADQTAQLAADYDNYFAAQQAYDQKSASATAAAPDQVAAIMDRAKSDLTTAAASVKDDELQGQLQQTLSDHDATVRDLTDQASQRAQMIGQPAADFSTVDLHGNPVKLSDFSGKVVVMDFWYRGCGWCMFAMPQIKQIVQDFKNKPVAVLGMNTDADEKDARVVMEAQGLNYRTLKAVGLAARFNVHAFPTLMIIDEAGVIRGFDVGYSPTLREDVEREIRPLLQTLPGHTVAN